ncbi:MAG: thioredoxin family protein [Flaviaesturariibacter sp.]|nr:thioredoxin family protein [Flaviaesturariibacter sp.]
MKALVATVLVFFALQSGAQPPILRDAEATAKKEGKLILIAFSGSDWCIPCIRLEKEVFTGEAFKSYAASHLVVLHADFPRLKKHQLPKDQKKTNEALAALYNTEGNFPYTVLLSATGAPLKTWDGNSVGTPQAFVAQLQALAHDK